jgi:hypothetical protein
MKTLEAITDICRLLDERKFTVEESMRVLEEARQFLAFSERLRETDLDATPKAILESAKDRIKRIAQKKP